LLVGIPLSVTAACLGKALETGIILRFSVENAYIYPFCRLEINRRGRAEAT
jgi:hypothetical protein